MDLYDNTDVRAMDAESGPDATGSDAHARSKPSLDTGGRLGAEDGARDGVSTAEEGRFEDDSLERPD